MFGQVLVFVAFGLFIVILAVPMILGKVPPNGIYGFRTKKTMADPKVWYPANAYAGKWLLAWGAAMMTLGLALLLAQVELTEDGFAILFSVIALGGMFVVVFMCWRHLKKFD